VVVLSGTLVFIHGSASAGEIAGVLAVGAGILLVRGPRVGGDRVGLLLALATGAFIAGYTLVDKEGLKHAAPIPYIELVLVAPAVLYTAWIGRVRGRAALRAETTPMLAVIGVVLFGTYVLVLEALKLASAPSVSAVRETSVVVATGLAVVILREHVTVTRFAGAVLVAGGVALLALS
jgi:drug/metabolite transporter (DMT)-like permease